MPPRSLLCMTVGLLSFLIAPAHS
ncbi:MAG: hypothetical protein K0R53_2569, partial [Burkholderiales bacterium]|nr:hypothetical protein [Burkholderiales bacterium]